MKNENSYISINENYIKINDGVIKIDDGQFMSNEKLENIFIPQSVTEIGARAFFGCKNLKDVVLPKNLTSIRRAAFYYCRGINRIVIPRGITKIEKETFLECSLNNVIFPPTLEIVDDLAFAYNKFTTVNLPKSIKFLGHGCFYKTRHIIAYNEVQEGLNYALHNLKPGLAISAIPWLGHRLTIKDSKTDDILFSIYIAGSYWIPTRNKILSLYNGTNFDIEQYDSLFETIRAVDDRINVAILRLKFQYELSDYHKKMYIKFLRDNSIMTVQKIIYEDDIEFLKWVDNKGFITSENIDRFISSSYEKDNNVETRSYLLKRKINLSQKNEMDLYL